MLKINYLGETTYLSTPVASPCKTECQSTGKNSTRPILFSSLYLLKCDFCSSSDIDLKSSTKIEKVNFFLILITSNVLFKNSK